MTDVASCVYVIQFSSGVVKVGYTTNWARRLTGHHNDAAAHGISITRTWVSPVHSNARKNERDLIAWCRTRGQSMKHWGEYFAGIDFDDLVTYAQMLNMLLTESKEAPISNSCCDDWIEKHTLTVEAIMHEVMHGRLLLIDPKSLTLVHPKTWLNRAWINEMFIQNSDKTVVNNIMEQNI